MAMTHGISTRGPRTVLTLAADVVVDLSRPVSARTDAKGISEAVRDAYLGEAEVVCEVAQAHG
jgi:hypothetical protein